MADATPTTPEPTPPPAPVAITRTLNVPGCTAPAISLLAIALSLFNVWYLRSVTAPNPRPAVATNWRTQGKEYGAYLCLSAAVSLENGARAARATKDLSKGRDAAKADFRTCIERSWDLTIRPGLDVVYPPGSAAPTEAQIETYAAALEEAGKGLRDKIGWTRVDQAKLK